MYLTKYYSRVLCFKWLTWSCYRVPITRPIFRLAIVSLFSVVSQSLIFYPVTENWTYILCFHFHAHGLHMVDNFANNWGASYVLLDRTRRSHKRSVVDVYNNDDSLSEIELRSIIDSTTQGYFSLEKLTPNGSDANLFAISSLSNGNSNGVLVGCGSYVAGDLGPLQTWSTADFRLDDGPSFISQPDTDQVSNSARFRTIALPYCIEGIMSQRVQQSYEDLCSHLIHKRCVYQHSIGQPVTVLFLELMLASNGCTLSDRFLSCLGKLSMHHSFGIIVDEILTGARNDCMLMTMQAPKLFAEQVSYVTLGKFCNCGIVLTGKQHDLKLDSEKRLLNARGVTTALQCSIPLPFFRQVQRLLHTIPARRRKCISNFQTLAEKDCWGIGLIIFIPRRCTGARNGTANRLLPLLDDVPADSLRSTPEPSWTRRQVNNKTMSSVLKWANSVCFLQESISFQSELPCLYHMINHLVEHRFSEGWVTSADLHVSVTRHVHGCENASMRLTTNVLRCLEKAGYIKKQLKTHRRLQGWSILMERLDYHFIHHC